MNSKLVARGAGYDRKHKQPIHHFEHFKEYKSHDRSFWGDGRSGDPARLAGGAAESLTSPPTLVRS